YAMSKSVRRALLSATAACAFSLLAMPVHALPDHSKIDGEIIVTDKASGSPTALSPAAARAMLNTIPGGVSLVRAEDFASRYAVNFQDMLAAVPGVYA